MQSSYALLKWFYNNISDLVGSLYHIHFKKNSDFFYFSANLMFPNFNDIKRNSPCKLYSLPQQSSKSHKIADFNLFPWNKECISLPEKIFPIKIPLTSIFIDIRGILLFAIISVYMSWDKPLYPQKGQIPYSLESHSVIIIHFCVFKK